jgi:cytochrome b involved in lipid metabolism
MTRRLIAVLSAVGLAALAVAPAAVAAPKSYTAAQVAKHASVASCWTIVGTSVYDVTKYVARHPGGPAVIKAMCGKDGSAMFRGQHAGEPSPTRTLAKYRIGALRVATSSSASSSSGASSTAVITAATVAKHSTPADCWTTISGRVYDLTPFISSHPGGAARIITLCGIDGTSAFSGQHAGNRAALAALAPLVIGTDGTVTASAGSAPALPSVSTGAHDSGEHDSEREGDDD